jgi:hypothetical protein
MLYRPMALSGTRFLVLLWCFGCVYHIRLYKADFVPMDSFLKILLQFCFQPGLLGAAFIWYSDYRTRGRSTELHKEFL